MDTPADRMMIPGYGRIIGADMAEAHPDRYRFDIETDHMLRDPAGCVVCGVSFGDCVGHAGTTLNVEESEGTEMAKKKTDPGMEDKAIQPPDPATVRADQEKDGAGFKGGIGTDSVLGGGSLVEMTSDVFEDRPLPGTTDTARVLFARKGQLVPQSFVDEAKERGVKF